MKKLLILFVLAVLISFTTLGAAETFEAPVPDGGKSVNEETAGVVNLLFETMTFEAASDFYMEKIKDLPETKWQEYENENRIVIYDWANRKWHQINILDNGDGKGVTVSVRKDSWTWIIGTLVIRFVGVFIVLVILMIALIISGKVLPRFEDKPEPKKA